MTPLILTQHHRDAYLALEADVYGPLEARRIVRQRDRAWRERAARKAVRTREGRG